MKKMRFLIDEDTVRGLAAALYLREPAIDILCVGDGAAPPRGTLDPALLLAAEGLGRTLISNDKKTMPGHLNDHWRAGHHTAGVILLRQGFSWRAVIDKILELWTTTTTDEWIDRTDYIPQP